MSSLLRRAGRLGLVVGLVVLLVPGPLRGQEDGPGGHRKWIYALVGGVAVGVPAALSSSFIDTGGGGCTSPSCFAPIAAAVGAGVGFMIGLERDEAAARVHVPGPDLELEASRVELPMAPVRALPFRRGALLLGQRGLAQVDEELAVTPVPGVRGLTDAAVLETSRVLVGASTRGLFAFPLEGTAIRARQIYDEGARRIVSDGRSRLLFGGATGLRLLNASGDGTDVSLQEEVRATLGVIPSELAWPGGAETIWVLAGPRLLARSAETLEEVGSLVLPSTPSSVTVDGRLGVAAAGEAGVYVLDVSDPSNPRLEGRYDDVNYAYDAAIRGETAYVAAGAQGLVILDVGTPSDPRVAGVVGNLGRPNTVLVNGADLYVMDRESTELKKVSLDGR